MASGDVVGYIDAVQPPAANFAAPGVRAGGSTPGELVPLHAFDGATAEYLDFYGVLHNYAGGGVTVRLKWAAATVTSGAVVWGAAFRRRQDDAEDLDASHTYDYNNASAATVPSAAGEESYDVVTFTDGADMDSLANNEAFVLRVRRNPADAGDTVAEDAQLLSVVIEET
jgi:hypothetical protein